MAAPHDLTDAATVRAVARIKRTDADSTTRLAVLISAMSRAVGRYTARQLLGKLHGVDLNASTVKTFVYDGRGYLSLEPYEAREISSVVLDGTALTVLPASEAIGSTKYIPQPMQKTTEDTYLYLTLPQKPRACDTRPSLVVVTAKWGVDKVPEDVELATIHAVANAWGNPEGAAQRTIGDGMVISDTQGNDVGGSLPREARNLLAPFKRV